MKEEQLNKGNKLVELRHKLRIELKTWQEMTGPHNLGYVYSRDFTSYASELESNIPDNLFQGFRESAINYLELAIEKVNKELEDL